MIDALPTKDVWHETRKLMRPVRRRYLGAALAVIASTLITLAGPALVRYAVDAGIAKKQERPLDVAALAFIALALAKPLVVRTQTLLAASAGETFLGALRTTAFDKLQALPLGFFERERAGVLVSRLTSDVQSLTEFIREALIEVVGSGLQIVLTVVALVILSPTLAAVSLVALPILLVSSWAFHHSAGRVYHAIRDRVADTLTVVQEGLAGVRVVQAFRRETRTLEEYRPRSDAQVHAWRRASFVNIRLFTMIPLAQTAALIAVLLVAASMYRKGSISEGTIAAYVLYLIQLFDPVARFSEWLGEFRQGLAALGKVVALLRVPSAIVQRADAVELPREGVLTLRNVTFGYGDSGPVVRDVSLELRAGEHVALVGATGAGKSTVAKLLTRQYDPQSGTIDFGGVDLRDATLESLHRRIVMLPQEGHLFSGTIGDNVRLAHPEASDDDVVGALRRISALERFEALPDGLETDVQTRGLRLSAGERQLVGIARVALADPAVIVLDEATSSLDPATEAAVERALAAVAAGRTVVTIAHRLSTAERADRVVVMEHGRAVEVATHDELVEHGERYAKLWASWQAGLAAGAVG
jgi:ATP-binding cassette subfamily B protein